MNNWIDKHKVKAVITKETLEEIWDVAEVIPFSALLELFSKDGEQLASEMYPISQDTRVGSEGATFFNHYRKEGFLEAYNLQQVKIEALKDDLSLHKDELSIYKDEISNYANLLQEKDAQFQALKAEYDRKTANQLEINQAWAKENEALKKEVEEVTATCKKWYDAAMYFQDMGRIGINMEDPNMRKIPDAGEFDPNRPDIY